jgi:ABC-type transport system substrate-binding protein
MMEDMPTGKLLIAVTRIGAPNGLPRFCSASAGGCAEIIYMAGITETLFNSALDATGSATTEPMLATEFTLDPSLEYGDFTLREGVQFHDGYGEMTSEDVAFSYNDANSVTNPESVHGQAGDFAPLIANMEAIDPYTVRLNYRNYDSRGVLHRFSRFWQTAGIVSKAVFDDLGVEGMQRTYIGVGAFQVNKPHDTEGWVLQKHIKMTAFPDYYARGEGNIGPFVQELEWRDIPAGESRVAALQAGEAQIAQVELAALPNLLAESRFDAQRGGAHNAMFNVSMASGNYWEEFGALTGEKLERDRETDGYPYIGNPFESGAYDENTPSMQSSKLVRNALAWGIERDDLVENIISGLGVVNHQPYLSINNPSYSDSWSWGTDYDQAMSLLSEAGYPDGFEMDMWIGTGELNAHVGEAVGAGWQQNLDVKVNLIKTEYGTFRPGLVARTNKTPFTGCGDENHSNFPFDWAHGFVMSSISAGGYGVGMEIPWAAETYLQMAGEPDKAKREELATAFYTNNREWANCVGVFEFPIWPAYNVEQITTWDQRPMANGNLAGINNVRTIKLAQ